MSTARGSTSVLCIQHPDHLAELLAMMYGCTKFNQYFHGKKEEVQSDHKPLDALFKKKKTTTLFQAPQSLQRMMLGLLRYDLQVEYEPGKNLLIADTLSRSPKRKALKLQRKTKNEFEVLIIENMPVSGKKLEQCKDARRKDLTLQKLKNSDKWMARKEVSRRPSAT